MPRKADTTKPKKKMGRPRKEIDQRQFESLCAIQCTLEEVCAVFDCDDVTLNAWCKETYGTTFSEVFKVKRQTGLSSLRRAQFKMAQTNPTMNIWMAKNYLGQKETIEVESKESLSKLDEILNGLKENAQKQG